MWESSSEHYFLCSMTHYDITIGNYVARDVHYEIIVGHSFVVGTYHDVTMYIVCCYDPHLLSITSPNYDISVFLVKSLKLYIKH